jgi:hypothetical protein
MATLFDKLKGFMARWIQRSRDETAFNDPSDNKRRGPSSIFRHGKRGGKARRDRGDKRLVSRRKRTIHRGVSPHYESFPRATHKAIMLTKGQRTKNR